jgi:hypothetical protein
MRKTKTILQVALAAVALAAFSGCSTLIPKKVELGQREVQAVPKETAAEVERRKQAAEFAARKIAEVVDAAERNDAGIEVLTPAKAAEKAAHAVSLSLGPPIQIAWTEAIAKDVIKDVAKLDRRLEIFREFNDRWEGYKIEGSGRIQVPYFMWIGGIFLLIAAGYVALKIGLGILANANPAVGGGLAAVRVAGSLAGKALGQVLKGGEAFKNRIKETFSKDEADKILAAFRDHQEKHQDDDAQELIRRLTRK